MQAPTIAATPAPILRRLQEELAKTLRDPDVRSRLAALAATADTGNSETFAKTIATEIDLWTGVAKAANIKSESN